MKAISGTPLERLYRQFHFLVPLEMFLLDRFYRISYANTVFQATFPDANLKTPIQEIIPSREHPKMANLLARACENPGEEQEQFTPLGREHPVSLLIKYDPECEIFLGMFTPVSLGQPKMRDPVTGLPNQDLFLDRLSQLTFRAERHRNKVAVLFLRLEKVRGANILEAGAEADLLNRLSLRMRSSMRKVDTLSRLEDDEFVMALADLQDATDASFAAGRILSRIQKPLAIGSGEDVPVTFRVGTALYPDDDSSPSGLIRKARSAAERTECKGR